MPRIAAAVGVFALIAFSIGFNLARYPVVWEMVGVVPQLSQPSQPRHPAAAAEPSAGTEPSAATPSEPAVQSTPPEGSTLPEASNDRAATSETISPSASGSELAPGGRRGLQEGPAAQSDLAPRVRRLPPIDRVAPPATGDPTPVQPGDPPSLYPTTGG